MFVHILGLHQLNYLSAVVLICVQYNLLHFITAFVRTLIDSWTGSYHISTCTQN